MNKGLCIGGPLDGEYAEHASNMLKVPQTGETVYRADGTQAAYQPNLWYRYVFVTRYWMPYDERSGVRAITHALDILDRSYAKTAAAKKHERDDYGA